MKSVVYHADPTARAGRSLLDKLSDLFERAGGPGIFQKGERVAVKVHFGEEGNTTYLNPAFARLLVEKLKQGGARPFLTDTNTLYRGKRHKTEDHLFTARRHGYTEDNIGAPLIIGDEFIEVPEGGEEKMEVSRVVREADGLLLITHVTGHMLFGYAGALKNTSMGCAAPAGKQIMHSGLKPKVNREKCLACGTCVQYCPVDAITLKKGGKARINQEICIGCGECIAVCPAGAIPILWRTEASRLAEKSSAYARAIVSEKKDKILCFNFLLDITPDCDCCDWSEPSFVPDQGILASRDIVAVDQAAVDLIQKAPLLPGCTAVKKKIKISRRVSPGVKSQYNCLPRLKDKFKALFGIDVELFLADAEESGLGPRSYHLNKIV